MVFPSVPLYLDPPTWNQQQVSQPIINSDGVGGSSNQPLQQQQQQQQLPPHGGSAPPPRPNSMAERARLAKIPQPEPALKCPRCDSTNTKFCYFNNYSLSQPRHFCKACRRYWTRGGALRSVPVGGGCRRNKRSSKSSGAGGGSSKSSADRVAGASPSGSTATSGGVPATVPPPPQMPFLHPMMDYGGSRLPNIGLGFHGMQQMEAVDQYHLGIGNSSGMGMEQWRPLNQIHQFPFLGGLEPPPPQSVSGLFAFDDQDTGKGSGSAELASQLANSVKMEDNRPPPRELNMGRQYFGVARNDQFWGAGAGAGAGGVGAGSSGNGGSSGSGGGWMTDLSGFNSSGNLL